VIDSIAEMKAIRTQARKADRRIGFVPTMGALHEGHLSLMRAARADSDLAVASVFVNPTQFGPNEDLDAYPRQLAMDAESAEGVGIDIIFAPSAAEMYPDGYGSYVGVRRLTEGLCGRARPGHFEGVTTVCTKLFNIVMPDVAYFGQKDYQQATVIRQMVADLDLDLRIAILPTVRAPDGLALSSRNKYLSDVERERALNLSKALFEAQRLVASGATSVKELIAGVRQTIGSAPEVEIDYVEIVDARTLVPLAELDRPAAAALAVRVGEARLIDNILLNCTLAELS